MPNDLPDEPRQRVHAITALDRQRVIGVGPHLPWRIPEDMQQFKRLTVGCAVIMGRLTYESIPLKYRPLQGRMNIVVSRTMRPCERNYSIETWLTIVSSVDAAIAYARACRREPWIIGGAQIYAEALRLGVVTDLHMTLVDRPIERVDGGQVVFPMSLPCDHHEWMLLEQRELASQVVYHRFTRRPLANQAVRIEH